MLSCGSITRLPRSRWRCCRSRVRSRFSDWRERSNISCDRTSERITTTRRPSVDGTAVTIDFETVNDHAATIRSRDEMTQDRVPLDQLQRALAERLSAQ
ncbi:MAG: hypothetical protein E6I84_03985 [Chloroflexi bacterium]|nr:MAG: hypothetical protein E6I84_03985 [Chloroflexota bacterium]